MFIYADNHVHIQAKKGSFGWFSVEFSSRFYWLLVISKGRVLKQISKNLKFFLVFENLFCLFYFKQLYWKLRCSRIIQGFALIRLIFFLFFAYSSLNFLKRCVLLRVAENSVGKISKNGKYSNSTWTWNTKNKYLSRHNFCRKENQNKSTIAFTSKLKCCLSLCFPLPRPVEHILEHINSVELARIPMLPGEVTQQELKSPIESKLIRVSPGGLSSNPTRIAKSWKNSSHQAKLKPKEEHKNWT